MDWHGCDVVEVIPGKVSGVLLVKGSRVQADAVLENAEAGESVEQIAYNFDLRPEDIRKVLAFAAWDDRV
jgi:uncharacterized protein (DUF433 family)